MFCSGPSPTYIEQGFHPSNATRPLLLLNRREEPWHLQRSNNLMLLAGGTSSVIADEFAVSVFLGLAI